MQNKFTIHDIVPNPSKTMIIFLLESPYKAEIENGYPVAGLSGSEICRILNLVDPNIPSKLPFGKYMSTVKDERFGIVNCSNLPMDIKTYPVNLRENPLVKSLDRIRKNPKTTPAKRQNLIDRQTHTDLIKKLKNRLEKLINQNPETYIISCGNLAKYFLEATNLNHTKTFHIAHPSFNQWRQAKNLSLVEELLNLISIKIL